MQLLHSRRSIRITTVSVTVTRPLLLSSHFHCRALAPYSISEASPDHSLFLVVPDGLAMLQRWQQFMPLEQLMAQEANPANPVIITICLTLLDNPQETWLRTNLVSAMLNHPRFSSRILADSKGNFRFEPIHDFNLSYAAQHHLHLEPPSDHSLPYSQRSDAFSQRLSEIMSSDLDRTRPLWKIFFFPGWSIVPDANPEKSSTVVIRVHHSVADGIGLLKYFTAKIIDQVPDKPHNALIVPHRQKRSVSCIQNPLGPSAGRHQGKASLHIPEPGIWRRIYETFGDIYASAIGIFFPEAENILTRSQVQRKKVCALMPPSRFSVSMVKDAARIFGITINDMLFTALSGAVRAYLSEHDDDPNELKGLRCAVPFNGHMFDEYKASDISNQIALVALPLHVNVDSRLNRMKQSVATLRRVKRGFQTVLTSKLLALLARLPEVIRRPLWRHLTRASSVLFTNVPGPREEVSIGGTGISSIHFFAPADGNAGVVVGLFSYNGQLSVGVSGDHGRISDPERFVDLLGHEIEALIDMSREYS